jgi:hypothetical protein
MQHNEGMNRKLYLWAELLVCFGALPVLPLFFSIKGVLFLTLWALAIVCLLVWRREHHLPLKPLIQFQHIPRDGLVLVLKRWAMLAPLMVAFIYLYDRERFFELPLERPTLWVMIMLLYPLLSVFPQEVIYRLFFHDRYQSLFKQPVQMMLASGLLFGWGHVLFQNWVAVSMCIAGGIMFSATWSRSKSFPLVWIEHALYGCTVFTIGLGWYFYSGAVR